jgi:hypothetical protein
LHRHGHLDRAVGRGWPPQNVLSDDRPGVGPPGG